MSPSEAAPQKTNNTARLRFADLVLDPGQRKVTRNGRALPLSKLSYEFLRVLAQAWPNLVSQDELIASVWGTSRIITPDNLAKRVLLLRRSLADDATSPRYIEVVRGQGYRLIPSVERLHTEAASTASSAASTRPKSDWFAAAALGIVALALVAVYLPRQRAAPDREPVRFELTLPDGAPFVSSHYTRDVAISPDGTTVAYISSDYSIVLQHLNRIEHRRLAGLGTDVRNPAFSPDGSRLAYLDGPVLKTMATSGSGPPETIAEVGQFTDGDIDWSPDGSILVANSLGIQRIALDGSRELLLEPRGTDGERSFNAPSVIPGTDAILYSVEPTVSDAGSRVAILDPRTGAHKYLLGNATQPAYLDTGHIVFASANALQAVTFDTSTLTVGHERMTLSTGLRMNANGSAHYGIADDGTMVYVAGHVPDSHSLVWIDRNGAEEPLAVPPMNYTYPRLSPDGRFIALDVRWPDSDIWIWDIDRRALSRITNDPTENALPTWHPDGATLLFGDGRSGVTNIHVQAMDSGAAPAPLISSPRRQLAFDVSPDGRYVLVGEAHPSGAWHMYVHDLESGETWPLLNDRYSYWNTDLSPDGRLLVYQSDESGKLEVYVRPFPDVRSARWQISPNGGSKPMWSLDGGEIFYVSADNKLLGTTVSSEPEFSVSAPQEILDLSRYSESPYETGARPYDVSPVDGRFLIVRRSGAGTNERDRLVVNRDWTDELRRTLRR